MKFLKLLLLWVVMTLIMVVSWSLGFVVGNAITHTTPPAGSDPALAFSYFFGVCVFNAFLLCVLLWQTRKYSGLAKALWLVGYCFVTQFLLPQMDTFFFGSSIGIQNLQVVSILIAGFVMSLVTVLSGIGLINLMFKPNRYSVTIVISEWRTFVVPFLVLICFVYPLIYLTFGYYVAWQNENLRIFYSKSSELKSFWNEFSPALTNGLYLFQILRAAIWVIATIPIVAMLQHSKAKYFLVGLFTSLLITTQLFIPNPYMPQEIAMMHFLETTTSNFVWGVVMVFAVSKYLAVRQRVNVGSVLEKIPG